MSLRLFVILLVPALAFLALSIYSEGTVCKTRKCLTETYFDKDVCYIREDSYGMYAYSGNIENNYFMLKDALLPGGIRIIYFNSNNYVIGLLGSTEAEMAEVEGFPGRECY